jgi:hypothetical protein
MLPITHQTELRTAKLLQQFAASEIFFVGVFRRLLKSACITFIYLSIHVYIRLACGNRNGSSDEKLDLILLMARARFIFANFE